jgi:putative addiction module CopG family antidote
MSAKHTLNVSLTHPLRDFVDREVLSGRYQTASEVVRAALRLLQGNSEGTGGKIRASRITASDPPEKHSPRRQAIAFRPKL